MDLDEPNPPPRPLQLSTQLQSCQPLVQPSLVALLEQLMADVTTNSISNDSDVGDVTSVDSNDEAWNLQKRQQQQRRERRLAVVASLLRNDQLPARQRTKIEELVDDFDTKFSRDVHEMITDQHHAPAEYRGLDSNRDTNAEVETVLRLCPNTIKKTRPMVYNDRFREADDDDSEADDDNSEIDDDDLNRWVEAGDDDIYYPIQCLTCVQGNNEGRMTYNYKAIPFVHLFARLAIEFNSFDEDKRGGLMFAGNCGRLFWDNIFQALAKSGLMADCDDIEESHTMDTIRATEYKRFRQMGLMGKDDILENELLIEFCFDGIFDETSATFIIEWCPESLLSHSGEIGYKSGPLYQVAANVSFARERFRFLFDHLIRYYPYKIGICLLFKNVYDDTKRRSRYDVEERPTTPFGCAINSYKVLLQIQRESERDFLETVDGVLSKYSSTTPINTKDALITAAIDPSIHLDGLYFLMRRQPDVLNGMLKSSNSTNNSIDHDGNTTNARDTNTNTNTNTNISTNNNFSGNDDDSGKSTTHDQDHQNDDGDINNTTPQNIKRKRSHPIIVFDDDDGINNNATHNGNRKSGHPFIFFNDDVMN